MPAGRPTLLTPELIAEAALLVGRCLYIEFVADSLGVNRVTFRRWMRRGAREARRLRKNPVYEPLSAEAIYLDFCLAIKKAIADSVIADARVIQEASAKNWQASAWRLERRDPARWGSDSREIRALTKQLAELEERLAAYVGEPA